MSIRKKGDAFAGIGILQNITVSRTTILLTYLSSAVRCHATEWNCATRVNVDTLNVIVLGKNVLYMCLYTSYKYFLNSITVIYRIKFCHSVNWKVNERDLQKLMYVPFSHLPRHVSQHPVDRRAQFHLIIWLHVGLLDTLNGIVLHVILFDIKCQCAVCVFVWCIM